MRYDWYLKRMCSGEPHSFGREIKSRRLRKHHGEDDCTNARTAHHEDFIYLIPNWLVNWFFHVWRDNLDIIFFFFCCCLFSVVVAVFGWHLGLCGHAQSYIAHEFTVRSKCHQSRECILIEIIACTFAVHQTKLHVDIREKHIKCAYQFARACCPLSIIQSAQCTQHTCANSKLHYHYLLGNVASLHSVQGEINSIPSLGTFSSSFSSWRKIPFDHYANYVLENT